MCIYWGHICIFILIMKFLSLILWLGGLCTDANDTDNYTRWTNLDYIGSFGRIPNEPKIGMLDALCKGTDLGVMPGSPSVVVSENY